MCGVWYNVHVELVVELMEAVVEGECHIVDVVGHVVAAVVVVEVIMEAEVEEVEAKIA